MSGTSIPTPAAVTHSEPGTLRAVAIGCGCAAAAVTLVTLLLCTLGAVDAGPHGYMLIFSFFFAMLTGLVGIVLSVITIATAATSRSHGDWRGYRIVLIGAIILLALNLLPGALVVVHIVTS